MWKQKSASLRYRKGREGREVGGETKGEEVAGEKGRERRGGECMPMSSCTWHTLYTPMCNAILLFLLV